MNSEVTPLRILVVEDQLELRKLIRMTLAQPQDELHEAASADEAGALVEAVCPQVVVLDVMMPGEFDGLELCRRIRANPATRGTRIVMLSARGQQSDIADGMSAGADAYLVKPFSPQALVTLIEDWRTA